MKPLEFWNSTYREVNLFSKMNLIKITDDFKLEITLQDEATNKLIKSNPFLYNKPKIKSLKEIFMNLFKQKEDEIQNVEEITRRMRTIMKTEKRLKNN